MNLETLVAKAANYNLTKPPEIVAKRDDEATLYLYDAITPAGLGGISARDFVAALGKVKDAKTVHLRVNSPGGAVFEAKAMYQALREFPGRKVVHVDGLAASAATFVAMAADHIVTAPEATWFIHGAQTITVGGEAEHEDALEVIRMESANIRSIYARRTGQKEEDLAAWMDAETFMTAPEAKARGFTDEIAGEEEAKPRRMAADASPYLALAAETERIVSVVAERRDSRGQASRLAAIHRQMQERSRASAGAGTGQPVTKPQS